MLCAASSSVSSRPRRRRSRAFWWHRRVRSLVCSAHTEPRKTARRRHRSLFVSTSRFRSSGYQEIEMANLEKLVEELSTLTVLEAAQLSKLLEEQWGVSAAAPVAVAATGAAAAPP